MVADKASEKGLLHLGNNGRGSDNETTDGYELVNIGRVEFAHVDGLDAVRSNLVELGLHELDLGETHVATHAIARFFLVFVGHFEHLILEHLVHDRNHFLWIANELHLEPLGGRVGFEVRDAQVQVGLVGDPHATEIAFVDETFAFRRIAGGSRGKWFAEFLGMGPPVLETKATKEGTEHLHSLADGNIGAPDDLGDTVLTWAGGITGDAMLRKAQSIAVSIGCFVTINGSLTATENRRGTSRRTLWLTGGVCSIPSRQ